MPGPGSAGKRLEHSLVGQHSESVAVAAAGNDRPRGLAQVIGRSAATLAILTQFESYDQLQVVNVH